MINNLNWTFKFYWPASFVRINIVLFICWYFYLLFLEVSCASDGTNMWIHILFLLLLSFKYTEKGIISPILLGFKLTPIFLNDRKSPFLQKKIFRQDKDETIFTDTFQYFFCLDFPPSEYGKRSEPQKHPIIFALFLHYPESIGNISSQEEKVPKWPEIRQRYLTGSLEANINKKFIKVA